MGIDNKRINPFELLDHVSPHLYSDVGYLMFPHNWANGFTEKWTWNNEILTSSDRTEQRIQLRKFPRRTLALSLLVNDTSRHKLETWMRMRATRWFISPLWRDMSGLSAPIVSDDVEIFLDTTYFEYFAVDLSSTIDEKPIPRLIVVWDSDDNFEIRSIVSVLPGSITVDVPFTQNWSANSMVAPCFYCTSSEAQRKVSRPTDTVGEYQLIVDSLFNPIIPGLVDPELYRGEIICPFLPSWVNVEEEWENKWSKLDKSIGSFEYTEQSVNPATYRSAAFLISGREDIDKFIRFMHTLKGRLVPFWMPANDKCFEMVFPVLSGSSTITIEDIDYVHALFGSPAHSHIEITLSSNVVIRRKILSAITLPTGQERLTLDSPLPTGITSTNLIQCTWLEPVRLDTDEVTIHWVTDTCIEVTLAIAVLP